MITPSGLQYVMLIVSLSRIEGYWPWGDHRTEMFSQHSGSFHQISGITGLTLIMWTASKFISAHEGFWVNSYTRLYGCLLVVIAVEMHTNMQSLSEMAGWKETQCGLQHSSPTHITLLLNMPNSLPPLVLSLSLSLPLTIGTISAVKMWFLTLSWV